MAVQKMCDLFKIVHDENPKWSFTKAVNFIAAKNQDITGFSKSSVQKYATPEIKTLMHVILRLPKQPRKPKSLPSKLLEQFRKEKGIQPQQEQGQEQQEGQEEEESSETNVQNKSCQKAKTIVP